MTQVKSADRHWMGSQNELSKTREISELELEVVSNAELVDVELYWAAQELVGFEFDFMFVEWDTCRAYNIKGMTSAPVMRSANARLVMKMLDLLRRSRRSRKNTVITHKLPVTITMIIVMLTR